MPQHLWLPHTSGSDDPASRMRTCATCRLHHVFRCLQCHSVQLQRSKDIHLNCILAYQQQQQQQQRGVKVVSVQRHIMLGRCGKLGCKQWRVVAAIASKQALTSPQLMWGDTPSCCGDKRSLLRAACKRSFGNALLMMWADA